MSIDGRLIPTLGELVRVRRLGKKQGRDVVQFLTGRMIGTSRDGRLRIMRSDGTTSLGDYVGPAGKPAAGGCQGGCYTKPPRGTSREEAMKKDDDHDQLGLFGNQPAKKPAKPESPAYELYRGTPPHRGVDTSIEAAVSVMPAVSSLQEKVLTFLREQGTHGATDDEIATGLDMFLYTAAPRRRELVLLGLVAYSGLHRRTSRGNPARVWVAAEHAPADEGSRP